MHLPIIEYKKFPFGIFICMYVGLCECMTQCLQRPEEGIRFPETSHRPEADRALEEQQVLLASGRHPPASQGILLTLQLPLSLKNRMWKEKQKPL